MKISHVSAKGNSIAAGGDVTLNITIKQGASYEDILETILQNFQIDDPAFVSSLTRKQEDRSAEEKIYSILMMAKSTAFSPNSSYHEHFAENRLLETTLKAAVDSLLAHDYLAAHASFRKALELDPAEKIKPQIIYDFFVSGYVGYSLVSDVDAIRTTISEVRSRYNNHMGKAIQLSIAEAHQEVATRQTSSDMLLENEQILQELQGICGTFDIQLLNLQGLLYRRFGERKNSGEARQEYLERSMAIYGAIVRLVGEERISVEATNNWAIALVRYFELTGDNASLTAAEKLLVAIDYDAQLAPLPDFLALPKALNNLGNVYKQRLVLTGDLHCYGAALETYSRTERFWNERGSPYEWAMVQKNKADVRCTYMDVAGFHRNTAESALREIELSLTYRTEASAPYQYQRSMEVKTRLETLIAAH